MVVAVTGELEATAGEELRPEKMAVVGVEDIVLEVATGAPRAGDPTDNAGWNG